jgi:hypothetical protein
MEIDEAAVAGGDDVAMTVAVQIGDGERRS